MSSRDSSTDSAVPKDGLLVVTTSDEQELLSGDLEGLLSSLDGSTGAVVVLRDVRDDLARTVELHDRVLGVVRTPAVGISQARNAALDWIDTHGLARPDTVLAFPDDDCRYPPGLAETVQMALHARGCDVLLGSYGPSDHDVDRTRFPQNVTQVRGWKDLGVVASAGVFVRWATVGSLRFNPNLGVGSPLPAAEEIDLILRLLSRGRTVTYDPQVNVLHPYRSGGNPYARWEAWIALCMGHALARPRHVGQALRAWAGWGHRIATRQVSLGLALSVARKALNPHAVNSIRVLAREAVTHG